MEVQELGHCSALELESEIANHSREGDGQWEGLDELHLVEV
jgi:hypothetical protein